jgi:hypothetical protein
MNDRPRIEKLRRDHPVDLFNCGQEALNRFLVRYALQNQQSSRNRLGDGRRGEWRTRPANAPRLGRQYSSAVPESTRALLFRAMGWHT